jgi:hypothetical protein
MEWQFFTQKLPNIEPLTSDEESECYYDFVPSFVDENGYLPIECRECYKALIFWSYTKTVAVNFKKMLKSLPVSIDGKYNDSVVVFYFKDKTKMLHFLEILKEKLTEFNIEGKIQWRASGRYWQDAYPQFFVSAKEIKAVKVKKEITMKEWLEKVGIVE